MFSVQENSNVTAFLLFLSPQLVHIPLIITQNCISSYKSVNTSAARVTYDITNKVFSIFLLDVMMPCSNADFLCMLRRSKTEGNRSFWLESLCKTLPLGNWCSSKKSFGRERVNLKESQPCTEEPFVKRPSSLQVQCLNPLPPTCPWRNQLAWKCREGESISIYRLCMVVLSTVTQRNSDLPCPPPPFLLLLLLLSLLLLQLWVPKSRCTLHKTEIISEQKDVWSLCESQKHFPSSSTPLSCSSSCFHKQLPRNPLLETSQSIPYPSLSSGIIPGFPSDVLLDDLVVRSRSSLIC